MYDLLRSRGEASRPELASALGVSQGSVSSLAQELLAEGVLEEAGFRESAGGRRAAVLRLSGGYARACALEVTRRQIRGAVVDLAGRVRARAAQEADASSPEALVDSALRVARTLWTGREARGAPGLGVAVSGLVERGSGLVRRFPALAAWRDVPLGAILGEALGCEVRVANEVQAAARGELRFGAARGLASAVYLHVGRGIGAGLVADGRVVTGEHGTAGELGHVRASTSGALCHCGASGCLEAECSPEAVVAEARRALAGGVASSLVAVEPDALTFEHVRRAAGEGDRLARNLVERMGEEIGQALAGLVNVFDPRGVLLSERVGRGVLGEALRRGLDARVLPALRGAVEIREAGLGEDAALLGAADMVFDLVFSDGRAAR